jgi:uncharacterized protein
MGSTSSHLHKYCDYLTDIGEGTFELKYIRNKQKKEIDFLVVRDKKPWLPIEAKLSETSPSSNWPVFMRFIKCKFAFQVVYKPGVYKIIESEDYILIILSADLLLKYLC